MGALGDSFPILPHNFSMALLLRCHPAATIIMDLGCDALEIVLHRRAESHIVAPVRCVHIAIGLLA
jgi:hypothetical protein